ERVMARFLGLDVPVREAKPQIRQAVAALVPPRAGDFAQAMMDLGATLCAPRRTACMLCPLRQGCAASLLPDPTVLPVRATKAARPVRYGHAYLVTNAKGDV